MVLHLSGDVVLPLRELVAILDIKALEESDTADFIRRVRPEHIVRVSPHEEQKSVVLALGDHGQRVYFSPISSATLARRTAFLQTFEQRERD